MSKRLTPAGSVFALFVLVMVTVALGAGDEVYWNEVPAAFPWAAAPGDDLPVPAPGSAGVMTPFFSWPLPAGAATRLYLGFDPNTPPCVAALDPGQDWYIHGAGLTPGATYYWRVDLEFAEGDILRGTVWSFTTRGLRAQGPEPRDGQIHVAQVPALAWIPGLTAFRQDLYLGTDANAVVLADTAWPEYRQRLDARIQHYEPTGLDPNTTYYWRVDTVELNGTTHPGNLWSFTTWPQFQVRDPNLKAWWRFDEGQGETILDWSGHANHCYAHRGLWVPGRTGTARAFDRTTPPVVGTGASLPVGGAPFTLALWLWPRNWQLDQYLLWWGQPLPGTANGLLLRDASLQHTFGEDAYGAYLGPDLDEWIHVTVTHRGEGLRRIFLNGTPQPGVFEGTLTPPQVAEGAIHIGGLARPDARTRYRGIMDELRIYDRALAEMEVRNLVYGQSATPARPYPRDRSVIDVEQALPLTWQPLQGLLQQELYFGTSYDRVLTADPNSRDVYQGLFPGGQFIPADPLSLGRTYYWRVDTRTAEDRWVRGDLWRFSVADYLTIDDFESYSDAPSWLIFRTWRDGLGYDDPVDGFPGNGSRSIVGHPERPYAEQGVVYSGNQSLPLYYDNLEAPFYSQMDRQFVIAQDWTRRGIRELHLYFAGDPGNTVSLSDRLYVIVTDQTGRKHREDFPGEDLSESLQETRWSLWSIPLNRFEAQGLRLETITRLSVGIGDSDSGLPGGAGLIYIDDMRLSVR